MIISNEPGYYKTGEYGMHMRIWCWSCRAESMSAEKEMLGFEVLDLRAYRPPSDRR